MKSAHRTSLQGLALAIVGKRGTCCADGAARAGEWADADE